MTETLELSKLIGKPGAGIEHIDAEAATEADVAILHTPGLNAPSVAKFAVGGLITSARQMSDTMEHLREGSWQDGERWGTKLLHGTLGLVDLEVTGFETAKRLESFEPNLLIANPYISDEWVEAAAV